MKVATFPTGAEAQRPSGTAAFHRWVPAPSSAPCFGPDAPAPKPEPASPGEGVLVDWDFDISTTGLLNIVLRKVTLSGAKRDVQAEREGRLFRSAKCRGFLKTA